MFSIYHIERCENFFIKNETLEKLGRAPEYNVSQFSSIIARLALLVIVGALKKLSAAKSSRKMKGIITPKISFQKCSINKILNSKKVFNIKIDKPLMYLAFEAFSTAYLCKNMHLRFPESI